jgi:hypothetical protein
MRLPVMTVILTAAWISSSLGAEENWGRSRFWSEKWGQTPFSVVILEQPPKANPTAKMESDPTFPVSCLDPSVTSDRFREWGDNKTRLAMLEKVRQFADESGAMRSLVSLEIGLAGSRSIYNSVWYLETPSGVKSYTVETPDGENKPQVFSEREVDLSRYALLWEELADLRVWDTPSDSKTVGLRADAPVFYATVCRDGKLRRIRIENPPLPTWGKDDSFEQARRRHDKKSREFLLRPRDRAIEVLRLIQAF